MKKAFTIAEILICIIIIGAISLIMIDSQKKQNFQGKEQALKIAKAMRVVDEASAEILIENSDVAPIGSFMYTYQSKKDDPATTNVDETAYSDTFEICKDNTCQSKATTKEIFDLYSKHIKFSSTTQDFATNCTEATGVPQNVYGGQIAGGINIGFLVYDKVKACPKKISLPSTETSDSGEIMASEEINASGNCWGEVHIDTNGTKTPNVLGQDYFVFGLSHRGIEKSILLP